MSNLLLPLIMAVSSLSAVTQTNPVTGKPWDTYLLPSCRDLLPAAVQSTSGLQKMPAPTNPDASGVGCHFQREGKEVTAIYECGGHNLQRPGAGMGKPSPVDWSLKKPRVDVNEKLARVRLVDYDDDTPCKVMLLWPDPKGADTAKRLMKDLLAAVTPAVLSRPRLVAVYLDPESTPGRAFFTSAEAWKKEAKGMDGYMTLPEGFPKAVDGKSIPGLPAGKVALLGFCEVGGGAWQAPNALPGMQNVLVDGQGLTEACPRAIHDVVRWELDEEPEMTIGDRHLGMEFSHAREGYVLARAYLRGPDGGLIATAADKSELFPGVAIADCKTSLKKGKVGRGLQGALHAEQARTLQAGAVMDLGPHRQGRGGQGFHPDQRQGGRGPRMPARLGIGRAH